MPKSLQGAISTLWQSLREIFPKAKKKIGRSYGRHGVRKAMRWIDLTRREQYSLRGVWLERDTNLLWASLRERFPDLDFNQYNDALAQGGYEVDILSDVWNVSLDAMLKFIDDLIDITEQT